MSEANFNLQSNSTNVRILDIRRTITGAWLGLMWRWAPGATRRLILRLFFAPRAYRTSAAEEACLAQGRPFQIRVHDKTIRAWRWGRGPVVLLVHGWNGRGIQFHRFVEPLVAAGYTAVAVDGPAHGASTGKITSYFEFTDVVRTFLSRVQGLRIHGIIAHSFGAGAAINALAKERQAVKAVCISPALRLEELLHQAFERIGIPRRIYTALVGAFEARFHYSLTKDNPHRLVKELSAPLLIVHDTEDRTTPFRDSAEAHGRHDHVGLYATEGLGHRKILADETVIQVSLAYLERVAEDRIQQSRTA